MTHDLMRGFTHGFAILLKRDVRLALRQGMDSFMAVMFFVIAVALFPFGVGPDPAILARIASGVIWVAALLSSMLSLERLFSGDYEDGSLELLVLMPATLEILVLAKITAHWLTTGAPLIIAVPVLAVLLNMPQQGVPTLMAALAMGTMTLSLLGAVGAALILGSRRGGVLLSLLILPLFVPVLIFGVSAVDAALGGYDARVPFMMLSGFLILALPLCPWASATGIRQATA